nr:antimicrobial peptide {immobilized peptide E17KGG} [synthetic, Peptide Synthetic, 17 aa] [synthetic construct]
LKLLKKLLKLLKKLGGK